MRTDTVAALARAVARQVNVLHGDDLPGRELLARVFIHEVLHLPAERIAELVAEPASTESPRWDALLQGLVAWRCQIANPKLQTPSWAREAHLDEAWAPFGGSIRDDGWYTISVLSTPVPFLHRGIVLDQRNLVEL